jgi:hypothetical protein
MMTVATVRVALQVASAPETRTRKIDPMKYIFVRATDDAGGKWELCAYAEMGAELMRLKLGDRAGIQGTMAVVIEYGAPIVVVNVSSVTVIRLAPKADDAASSRERHEPHVVVIVPGSWGHTEANRKFAEKQKHDGGRSA